MLFTDDCFGTLNTVVSGNQRARAVSAIPIREGLIVPTDTPLATNAIRFFDSEQRTFEVICKLPGSAFFTGQAGNYLLVSTAVEPSEVNPVKNAAIFISDNEGQTWTELYRQKKDCYPMKWFQLGALALPARKSTEEVVYAYGQALNEIDGYMLKWVL
jgi:hypothetical protein